MKRAPTRHRISSGTTTRDVQAILDALRIIVEELRLSSQDIKKKYGTTLAQHFVLRQLTAHRALTINQLAAATHTHQSTVSVVVKRLMAAKLVTSEADRSDRRHVLVTMTPRGQQLMRSCPKLMQERLVEAIQALGPSGIGRLSKLLGCVTTSLLPNDRDPAMFFEEPVPRKTPRSPSAGR